MYDDSLVICDIDFQNDANDTSDWRSREPTSNETLRPALGAQTAVAGWAWAHRCDTYDWMDSHGPIYAEGPWD